MTLGKTLIICLWVNLLWAVVSRLHLEHDTWLKVVSALTILLTFCVFMAWIRKITSFESYAYPREDAAQNHEEPDEEEVRRQRRNARQRERRAEKRAQEEARLADTLKRKTLPRQDLPKEEVKSRWDRLLEEDEE